VISVAVLALFTAILVDATLIEPFAIEARHDSLALAVRAPLTIAHLSDLHTHGYGRRERRVVDLLAQSHPDLIVVTGDVVDEGSLAPARELFTHLSAPLGVWVVRGNWENWNRPPNERAFYESVGAKFLVNEGRAAREDVWIAGLDDPMSGAANLDPALRDVPPGALKIALFHSPEIFDGVAPRIDLAFAGHTHGGQVRAPFLGPLWLPAGSGRFVDGWYEAAAVRMFVSRGVGMSILPIRFLCRPEVEFVAIEPR
jgi:predicted MPP superfamily phosphohydrolase